MSDGIILGLVGVGKRPKVTLAEVISQMPDAPTVVLEEPGVDLKKLNLEFVHADDTTDVLANYCNNKIPHLGVNVNDRCGG